MSQLFGSVINHIGAVIPATYAGIVLNHLSAIAKSRLLRTATSIFTGADTPSREELIEEVLQLSPSEINPETLLEGINTIISEAPPGLLVATVKNATRAILNAFISTTEGLQRIQNGVLSNYVNAVTLQFIMDNGAELARFLVDSVEPTKCYVRADAQDDTASQDETLNRFNELDFSKSMNRQAAISQFQRLAKSIIFILSETTSADNTFEKVDITGETKLESDVDLSSIITIQPREQNMFPSEKWFFVNGIAGELFWLRLACEKLADTYGREITGIFNRGDGILWDLVECAGERTAQETDIAASQKHLVQRTKSSKTAQRDLKGQLKKALEDGNEGNIVMIAYSQGCLLLRLALEELVADSAEANEKILELMQDRLCVFTFGNPSLNWKLEGVDNSLKYLDLSSYSRRTEHFANTKDFVAKLGVVRGDPANRQNSSYREEIVFSNKDGTGHLFGAQYSLDTHDYNNDDRERSWLLTCKPGQPISADPKTMED